MKVVSNALVDLQSQQITDYQHFLLSSQQVLMTIIENAFHENLLHFVDDVFNMGGWETKKATSTWEETNEKFTFHPAKN